MAQLWKVHPAAARFVPGDVRYQRHRIEYEPGRNRNPTHESPTKFLLNESTNELTVNGYISRLPNVCLEKRLSAIFNDPDNTHYVS